MPSRSLLPRPAALLALALLGACSSPTILPDEGELALVPLDQAATTRRLDPAEVLAARIDGDRLHLQVRFGGGCRDHHFSLLHGGVFMESEPVQTRLQLAHDAHEDPCRALLSRELTFDLTPLRRSYEAAYARTGTIVIHLLEPGGAAVQPPLRYSF